MSMRRSVCWIALLGAAVTSVGCASAPAGTKSPAPPETYAEVLVSPAAGDASGGRTELLRVLEYCGTSPVGERVAIVLMVDALDPRHPDPDLSASLAYAFLRQPYRTPWAEQVAISTYLSALNLGGSVDASRADLPSGEPQDFPNECGRGQGPPVRREPLQIPDLPDEPVSERLIELERSVEALEGELSRVRETLRP